jgi:diacylglycerol kinase family enzyme
MADATAKTFDFIINRRAGTVMAEGEEKVRAEIRARFGERAGEILFTEGDGIRASVDTWAAAHAGSARGLIIGGGDGTVISAVEQLLGRNDVTLGVLPLGTQNMVARHLGFSADFRAAAAQYKDGGSVEMDVGRVNGMHFLLGITVDGSSRNIMEAREALRDRKGLTALRKGFSAMGRIFGGARESFTVTAAGGTPREVRGRIVYITNNDLSPQAIKGLPLTARKFKDMLASIITKGAADGGSLTLYVFKGGPGALAIVPDILRGKWAENRAVEKETSTQFVLQSRKGGAAAITVDGEIRETSYPVEVSILPRAVRIFQPR